MCACCIFTGALQIVAVPLSCVQCGPPYTACHAGRSCFQACAVKCAASSSQRTRALAMRRCFSVITRPRCRLHLAGKWPDDPEAYDKLKAALALQVSSSSSRPLSSCAHAIAFHTAVSNTAKAATSAAFQSSCMCHHLVSAAAERRDDAMSMAEAKPCSV